MLPVPRADGTYSHLRGQGGLLMFLNDKSYVIALRSDGTLLWEVRARAAAAHIAYAFAPVAFLQHQLVLSRVNLGAPATAAACHAAAAHSDACVPGSILCLNSMSMSIHLPPARVMYAVLHGHLLGG
jgi:hypothetical protein